MSPVPAALPLTATQEGIWLAELLEPGESGYHDTAVSRVVGELDPDALRAALSDVQRHHEALRCRLVTTDDGVPTQVFDVDAVDWSYREAAPGTPVERLVGLDSSEPFDLAEGPLWRVRLIRTGPAEHVLIVVTHHLVTDGWSHGVFLRTLLACYLARTQQVGPALPAPALSYHDWIVDKLRRERDARHPERVREAAARLVDAPRRWAPAGLTDGVAGRRATLLPVPLPAPRIADFRQSCRALHTTPYMALAGLFALLLARRTGTGEVVVAAPVAHRADPRTAPLMGCMIDVVPVRVEVDPAGPVRDAVVAGRAATVAALRHLDVPYREISRALRVPPGDADPLTNLSLEEFNAPMGTHRFAGLEIEALPRVGLRTRHDLSLSVPAGLSQPPELLVPAGRWRPGTVAALAEEFAELVAEV
ncbi:condensation domain-containing protein [Micromonospora sp. NBS 11-29]|uniref:condensation domain-containing protein n=1 Tax=Micromonospora sp. NBS 11-29 TaxID=1960879 RepID=UPI0015931D3B|nr:condensation domain-containing protein [Micromonospora sp. NBS 11-29]